MAQAPAIELKQRVPVVSYVPDAFVDEKAPWQNLNHDEAELALFGKKQQLKRRFGIVSIVALTCTLMISWEATLIVMAESLLNGGPLGSICVYIFAWVGVSAQVLNMAEMGSMIPLAGGQYNWVSILAPPSCSRFLSYLTGWITTIAWQAITASGIYLVGTIVQGVVILNWPEYAPTPWQTTLLFYAVIIVASFVNTVLARALPQIETLILLLHILGFFGILIPLVYLGPKGTASDVFQTWINAGGWSSDGLTFFVGTNISMLIFIGIDGATHMAEEIEGASAVIPKAMIWAVGINGVTGLAILIAALFSITDFDTTLNTPTGYPFMQIFLSAVGSPAAATGMIVIILVLMIFATIGVLATSSRMLWAFAREGGVPGHRWIAKVHASSSLPLVSIGVCITINALLALISLGSAAAFNAFTSLTVSAFYTSFALAAGSMLWRKTSGQKINYGPFRLGRWGVPVTIFSLAYSFLGIFFSFWPLVVDPTLELMNWAVVVFAGTIAFAGAYWLAYARHHYTGPIMEISIEVREGIAASMGR